MRHRTAKRLAGQHRNVVGHNFRDLRLQLDEIIDAAEEASDTIAERMRSGCWLLRDVNRAVT